MAEKESTTEKTQQPAEDNPDIEHIREFLSDPPDWLPESFVQYAEQFNQPWLLSLLIITIGFAAAWIIKYFFNRSLNRFSAIDNTTNDLELIRQFGALFFTNTIIFTLILAVTASPLLAPIKVVLNRLLVTVLLIYFIVKSVNLSNRIFIFLKEISLSKFIKNKTVPLFSIIFQMLVLGMGSYLLIVLWGYDPKVWLASAGIIGIAIGFAAKDTLANLFAGVFIIADTQYQLDDYIVLDSTSKERGKVTHIGLRSTRILNRDDIELTIPNSIMGNAIVANESGGPYVKSRIRVPIGVAYGSELDRVIEVLLQASKQCDKVCESPEPRVRVRSYGASSIDMELLCWISHPSYRGLVKHQLYMDVYKRFAQEKIEIPYPKQDLYIKQMPELRASEEAEKS